MKKWVKAKIKWLSEEEGGRRSPVPAISNKRETDRYCPIIVFFGNNAHSWSADIQVQSQISKYESVARISYLSESAPFDLLHEGASFELYEGSRLVATGTVGSEESGSQRGTED